MESCLPSQPSFQEEKESSDVVSSEEESKAEMYWRAQSL
jgi:hypothetical protein